MAVLTATIFSAIIICITVLSIVKVLRIGFRRGEISLLKYRVLTTSFIGIGISIAFGLYFGYRELFEIILGASNN